MRDAASPPTAPPRQFLLNPRATFLTLNLLPFLASPHAWIGIVVVVNGAACHNAFAYAGEAVYKSLRRWDVACNVALVCFVNYTTSVQPATLVLSGVSVCAWAANNMFWNRSAVVHATMVQWPLCAACIAYV